VSAVSAAQSKKRKQLERCSRSGAVAAVQSERCSRSGAVGAVQPLWSAVQSQRRIGSCGAVAIGSQKRSSRSGQSEPTSRSQWRRVAFGGRAVARRAAQSRQLRKRSQSVAVVCAFITVSPEVTFQVEQQSFCCWGMSCCCMRQRHYLDGPPNICRSSNGVWYPFFQSSA